ncbi:hypothetical protein J7I98_26580 [Streptomyces sp. ISL-98]|uniref:hypothetical protein n=1 Tax=Streptomyces sp. ISL-98 TaxID=2819192 RepID=UPI001BEA5025|nr:hypothetical protein [Streptomyces sp. ISL-98]MBT2509381.1 hypothetical protein [Streptomyces sp. ISL-98]
MRGSSRRRTRKGHRRPFEGTGPRLCLGLGCVDGIADDIPKAERQAWQADVLDSLAKDTAKPPNYRDDAVKHLTASWRQGLASCKPSETWFLREQITEIVHTWAVGRGMNPDCDEVDNLQEDALNDASTRLGETEETMKCTRKPEEQPCP